MKTNQSVILSFMAIFLCLGTGSAFAERNKYETITYATATGRVDTVNYYNLGEVSVTERKQNKITIGKSGISEMDMPQAITLIDTRTLDAQQVFSITDLLKNANGMYIMGSTGGYQEEIASRGTSITSTNTFKNGIRYYGGMKTEMSGIESAEILKGNSALLFGNVAPGGVLNLVTKKPLFDFGGSVSMIYGGFDKYKPVFDIYGSLNKKKTIAFRLDGSYEQANSFRKHVESKTYYINPSLLIKLTPKTTVLLEGDYTKDSRTPDFGSGVVNYQIVDIPRDRFLGVSWGRYKTEQSFVSSKITHKLSKHLNISSLTGFRSYNTDLFSNARPNTSGSVIASNGDWVRNVQRSGVKDNYFIEQVDLNAIFRTGALKHQLLLGFDVESYTTKTTAYKAYNKYDTINIYSAYDPANEPAAPSLSMNTLTTNPVDRFGIYLQDLISVQKHVKVLLGLRYSSVKSSTDVLTYATGASTHSESKDNPFSPKLGLIYQPNRNHSFFASYSNSFSLNTGTDINGNALDPSVIDQYEVGVKNKFFHNSLFLNVTAYRINNNNLAQTSLENGNTNSNIKELAGATRGEGVEVDMGYNPIENLRFTGGYSYSKTTYTQSNTYVVGSELRYNPKHTANLSGVYTFDKGMLKHLQAGFVSSYIGNRYAGRSTRVTVANDTYKLIPLKGYFLQDIVLGYDLKKWNFKAKLSNITNTMSYNVHDDNSLNPIEPFNFSVNVKYKFN